MSEGARDWLLHPAQTGDRLVSTRDSLRWHLTVGIKYASNPVLQEEPPDVEVTGFRDPFVAAWHTMDEVRGETERDGLYGILSGGIRDCGPTTFIYTVDRRDLGHWRYLGALIPLPPRLRVHKRWAPNLGINWECTSFCSLSHPSGLRRELLFTGVEVGVERDWVTAAPKGTFNPRTPRYAVWLFGNLTSRNGQANMEMTHTGLLDHGNLYAATNFTAPDGRTLLWGWIVEEDLSEEEQAKKGWIGCLGILREVYLQVIQDVVGTSMTDIENIPSFDSNNGTVSTLGIRPAAEIQQLRIETLYEGTMSYGRVLATAPPAYEIEAVIKVSDDRDVSITLRHSEDMSTYTNINFSPSDETIAVSRTYSNTNPGINKCDEQGPHTLLRRTTKDGEEWEHLHLRIFVDHDVLEIFANDRFALSTRVYSSAHCTGVSVRTDNTVESLSIYRMGSIGLEPGP